MAPGQPLQVQTAAGLMQVNIPDGVGPGGAFEMLVPAAAPAPVAPPPPPPAEVPSVPLMDLPPPADAMPPLDLADAPAAFDAADDDEPLPELTPLELDLDESKVALPSFDDYKKGPPKPAPPTGSYESKLPSINPGRSPYDDLPQKDEQAPFEKLVFNLTYVGIAFLIAVEIFINTPAFQQVKPVILKLTGGDSGD